MPHFIDVHHIHTAFKCRQLNGLAEFAEPDHDRIGHHSGNPACRPEAQAHAHKQYRQSPLLGRCALCSAISLREVAAARFAQPALFSPNLPVFDALHTLTTLAFHPLCSSACDNTEQDKLSI
jgi:hypothetical protein